MRGAGALASHKNEGERAAARNLSAPACALRAGRQTALRLRFTFAPLRFGFFAPFAFFVVGIGPRHRSFSLGKALTTHAKSARSHSFWTGVSGPVRVRPKYCHFLKLTCPSANATLAPQPLSR